MPKYELVAVKQLRDSKYNTGIAIIYYEDGVKKVKFTNKPTLKFYATKLEKMKDEPKDYTPITRKLEDVEPVECLYDERYDEIVRLQADYDKEGAENSYRYLEQCRKAKVSPDNLLLLPHTHGIDINLEDHYIDRFTNAYEKDIEIKNIRKGYFDIETNNRKVRSFVKGTEHTTPVNAISFFDAHTHTEIIRLLDNSGDEDQYVEFNPQIEDFKKKLEFHRQDIEEKLNKQQKELFPDSNLPNINLKIKFYSDELSLIEDHYRDIKDVYGIDYLMAWNQEFDINFTFGRVKDKKSYGYLCDLLSPEEIPVDFRDAYYIGDESAKDISKRNDRHRISSTWECIDMQYIYLKIRESMKKPEEYSLDYAMETELGIHKVQYEGEISDLPYDNFAHFVYYSAVDGAGLYWLDLKTADVDTMVMLSNLSHTRIDKSMTKTIMLRNFIDLFYKQNLGLVISNNRTSVQNKIYKSLEAKGQKVVRYPELQKYKADDKVNNIVNIINAMDEEDDEESIVETIQSNGGKKKVKFRGA